MHVLLKSIVPILILVVALTPHAQGPVPTLEAPVLPRPAGTAGGIEPAALGTAARVVVIDPGHGGDDLGVRGRDGVLEKHVALSTARRLRGLLETRLGARVILTRDDDTSLGLEARVAAANANRADAFVSLHFNGSPSPDAAGAVVYSLRLGREGEQARRDSARDVLSVALANGGTRTVELVPWAFAQARHLEQSARLATTVAQGLAGEPTLRSAATLVTPLRVLSEVDAPAILVELAYLTNAAQARLAASDEFQTSAADALFKGLAGFMQRLEEGGGR